MTVLCGSSIVHSDRKPLNDQVPRLSRPNRPALTPLLLLLFVAHVVQAAPTSTPTFDEDIQSIFKENCVACHAEESPQGELDLRSKAATLKGGKSGPAMVVGSSASSLLMDKVVSGVMPPGDARLTQEQIDTLRLWIDKGAPRNQADLASATGPAGTELPEHDIRPIFQFRCVACHGKRKQEAGLDLRTVAGRLKGGKSGPALIPGDPDGSLHFLKYEMQASQQAKMIGFTKPKQIGCALATSWDYEKWLERN